MFDFDQIIDRRDTHSSKWDEMEAFSGVSPKDGIPMWVADMDFRPPEAVNDAIREALAHGVHGYFGDDTRWRAAVAGWMARRHGWDIAPEAIATTHGVVPGLAICLRAFTEPGEGVILFPPVYHAFARIIAANDREIVNAPLHVNGEGRFEMDLDALAASLTGRERILVFCSPHNPGGRIWTPEEQRDIAEFCARHDLLLISDEIHHDLILPGHTHTVMPRAAPEHLGRTVTLTAATKTFNLAGAMIGNAIIPDAALRRRFAAAHKATGTSLNRLSVLMATAAYETGDAWCDALMVYLAGNAGVMQAGLEAIPGVRVMPLEATYLLWADFTRTGLDDAELLARLHAARVAPSPGPVFGPGGSGHIRFNLATPRAHIEDAVARITEAFGDLQ